MIPCLYRARRLLLGVGLAVSAYPAAAVTQIPQPLTLDGALAWAHEYNPELRAAGLVVRRRGGELDHADVAVPSNPRLELEAGERDSTTGSAADIGIRLSQELWIAGQGGLRQTAADRRLAAARADLEFLTAAVTARTRAAFLSVLVAEQAVQTAERVVATNSQLSAYADKRLEAGAGTRIESNSARLGLQRAKALAASARNDATQARLRLTRMLGIDPGRRLALAGGLEFAALDLAARDALITRAVARRADLQASAARIAAARADLDIARRRIVPNLTVFGFYREEDGGRNAGGGDIAGAGIGFDLPLLHRYEGEREIARADLERAQLDRDIRQREVRHGVLSALSAYDAARERADALSDAVLDAAQSTLELTRRSFAAGKVGAPAITSAQNTLIDVRRDYLDALADLVAAGTDLERVTGGLIALQTATGASR